MKSKASRRPVENYEFWVFVVLYVPLFLDVPILVSFSLKIERNMEKIIQNYSRSVRSRTLSESLELISMAGWDSSDVFQTRQLWNFNFNQFSRNSPFLTSKFDLSCDVWSAKNWSETGSIWLCEAQNAKLKVHAVHVAAWLAQHSAAQMHRRCTAGSSRRLSMDDSCARTASFNQVQFFSFESVERWKILKILKDTESTSGVENC